MLNRVKLPLMIAALTLAALACQTLLGSPETPTATFEEPVQIVPVLSEQEMRNAGTHMYTVTFTEVTCELELSEEEQKRTIEYTESQVLISNNVAEGFEIYDEYGENSYLRINNADKPILVTFSMDGYVLEVYDPGEEPSESDPCGYFTFTLAD